MIRLRIQLPLTLALLLAAALLWPATSQANGNTCAAISDIPAAECAALQALYSSTNGPAWTNTVANDAPWFTTGPACLWKGLVCESGHVVSLSLPANNLSGPLPAALGDLAALTTLDLGDNLLSGQIPATLGALPDLGYIDLGNNLLSGPIPFPISGVTENLFLYVDSNALGGAPPAGLCDVVASGDLNFNTLDVGTADACFFGQDSHFTGWNQTQTVPPLGVKAEALAAERAPGAPADTSIQVSWTPISPLSGPGGYLVLSAPTTAGPFTQAHAAVQGKEQSGAQFVVSGDPAGYVFVVRTFTSPGEQNKNALLSVDSNTAVVNGVAITLLDSAALPPGLSLVLLGPLALLLLTAAAIALSRRGR